METVPDATPPKTSTVLFSEIVAAADQEPEDCTEYQFSTGKRFERPAA